MTRVSGVCLRTARRFVAGFVASTGIALLGGTASATQIFHPTPNSCVQNNCNAVIVGGTLNSVTGDRNGPWTVELFAGVNQCLRLTVNQSGTAQNLEIVVVAPNGAVFRSAASATPLIKFVAPKSGWNSVSISQANGVPVEKDFDLVYGVYTNAGNPNCANPTPPR